MSTKMVDMHKRIIKILLCVEVIYGELAHCFYAQQHPIFIYHEVWRVVRKRFFVARGHAAQKVKETRHLFLKIAKIFTARGGFCEVYVFFSCNAL